MAWLFCPELYCSLRDVRRAHQCPCPSHGWTWRASCCWLSPRRRRASSRPYRSSTPRGAPRRPHRHPSPCSMLVVMAVISSEALFVSRGTEYAPSLLGARLPAEQGRDVGGGGGGREESALDMSVATPHGRILSPFALVQSRLRYGRTSLRLWGWR